MEIEAAIAVMDNVFHELWGLSFEHIRVHYDSFIDLEDLQAHYFDHGGTFLVLTDDDRVIGMGALGRLNDKTAEVKRVWLLKAYRGRGLGRKIVQKLLDFAQNQGYRRVQLMVATPQLQPQAVGLYRSLGFIALNNPNGTNDTRLFMEKMFEPAGEAGIQPPAILESERQNE